MVTLVVTMQPLVSLTHQVAFVTLSGLGKAVYSPVALNCTCRLDAGAVAVEGVTVMEVRSRSGPKPLVQPIPLINTEGNTQNRIILNFVINAPPE
jgi:hypothetical protein